MMSAALLTSLPESPVKRPAVLVLTENGFTIERACALNGAIDAPAGVYPFTVSDCDATEVKIIVEIERSIAGEIFARTHGRIDSSCDYWLACAERHLAEHLSTTGLPSPTVHLLITRLTPVDYELALRWAR